MPRVARRPTSGGSPVSQASVRASVSTSGSRAGGGIPVVGQRVVGLRARVEAAHRPLDDLPDDDAEGHAVGLAPLELPEQAEEDDLGRLVGGLAVAQAQEAELADGVEVAREQELVVAGLE